MGLQKSDKVEIGKGCIKYRNQTPLRSTEITPDNQNLAIELANTFVQFFKNENELNLGVEVVEQNDIHIKLFYFSDANILYSEFEERLNKCEVELWQLVKIQEQEIRTETKTSNLPDKLIAGTDAIISLVAFILKVATRIPLGKINAKELNSLLYTTSFGDSSQMHIDAFKTININQTVLLGKGNSHSINLKQ